MTTIENKIRDIVGATLRTDGVTVVEYLTSKVFTLEDSNVASATIKCYKNGTLWASANYSYNSDNNKVTVTGTLAVSDILEFTYSYYEKYSITILDRYIKASIINLSTEKYKTFTVKTDDIIFPTPSEEEENLIAIIASILMGSNIKNYRTPEITITFNDNMSKEDKITRVIKKFKSLAGYATHIDLDKNTSDTES
jgi:hypothetical protein